MPDPKFTKPWHGVPREDIHWNPTIIEDACIGCGTCVTGCSRLVYRYDFERKKPVVVDPLNCMVGCTTCANTCPSHAIAFPSIDSVLALEARADVRHAVEDDLLTRRDMLESPLTIPHPDRIITLSVSAIANSPHSDGSIDLHIWRIEGGRFTTWAFNDMNVGDHLQARGPLGDFTMRSGPDVPVDGVVAEHKHRRLQGIELHRLLHQQCQPVDRLAHVHHFPAQINVDVGI
ncbi:4Fe-4S dicluster domain-containing protein [Vreelandella andesensis]|uniref:4Fe-4S dicluster domain-containing protein n=1 Tax=Vreelandella andesensis TaxID=447567 RepID=A0A433KHK3_9GAMM|nr:4Fe-4S dicluster domain-containing protein [Halomonas andesensis]RUR28347.1 4Fe-4S dicluster domain-containing protein [Halomonas andesensis]